MKNWYAKYKTKNNINWNQIEHNHTVDIYKNIDTLYNTPEWNLQYLLYMQKFYENSFSNYQENPQYLSILQELKKLKH